MSLHFVNNLLAVDLGKDPNRTSVPKQWKPEEDHILRIPVEGVVFLANLDGATAEL